MAELKKDLMRAIINAFESGTAATDYSTIYIYNDGPQRQRQITLGFGITEYGNLKALIQNYLKKNGIYDNEFLPYVDKIGKVPLVKDDDFKQLLIKAASTDSAFRASMDEIFDQLYWDKAEKWFESNGFTEQLSMAVVLDSYIHSGSILSFLRSRFNENVPAKKGSEKRWISSYVKVRRDWLANHSNPILRNTVYRMDFFAGQIHTGNWNLECPLMPHGVQVC